MPSVKKVMSGHLALQPVAGAGVLAEVIAFGYLMLTPLVLVLMWGLLDREFLRKLWVGTTLAAALD